MSNNRQGTTFLSASARRTKVTRKANSRPYVDKGTSIKGTRWKRLLYQRLVQLIEAYIVHVVSLIGGKKKSFGSPVKGYLEVISLHFSST